MKTIPLGPFLGINNRLPDFALRVNGTRYQSGGDYLRSADNVDIDDAGRIRRRPGTAVHQVMSGPHSLKMTAATTGFLVRASALYAITLPAYTETLLKVLTSDARSSYANLGDSWYFSNGTDIGRVTAGVAYPIGLPTPAAPALAGIGGALEKGRYQVAIAYINTATGEEGGVCAFATHDLAATGGIRVTLPGATTGATHLNVYLSAANGTVPMLAATVVTGTGTHDLTALATGREFSGRHEAPLPAGTLFVHNGCLCSFTGSTLYIGLPYRPGYYLPVGGRIPFPSDISICAPVESGVYVAADKTYFIPGDLGDVKGTIRDVLPYGAVPGTFFAKTDDTMVGWFGAKGFVLVDTQGGVKTPMSDNVDLTPPANGVAQVFECDGYNRVVSCGWCMNLKTGAATTYSSWDFTSLSDCYGTKADGIYLTDTTGTATAVVGLGKKDFGAEEKKSLPAIYLGVSSTTAMRVRVQAPGAVDYTYSARGSSADLKMQRVTPGKGLKASWYELSILNTDGADFTMDTISFAPAPTQRRI